MSDTPPTPELLRSLGRLARGLSVLFWGLPIALLVCFQTANGDAFRSLNIFPPVIVLVCLFYGLKQLGHFQKQERIWHTALDRAKTLAIINIGLSPFLFWWHQVPDEPFFNHVVIAFTATGLLFLSELNLVLARLTAMLPEETLRQETKQFTTLNRVLILSTFLFALIFVTFNRLDNLPSFLEKIFADMGARIILSKILLAGGVFLVLSPLAITMALIWKTKEVILESVFGGEK